MNEVRDGDKTLPTLSARPSFQVMLKNLLSAVWRSSPRVFRRWSSRLAQSRFTVTVGGVIANPHGEVLLLDHVFRPTQCWGIPGGFVNRGEQPEDALRRELMEEVGLELDDVRLVCVRTYRHPRHVEIVLFARTSGEPKPRGVEIHRARWFALDGLPIDMHTDQRHLIERALRIGANPPV